MDLCTICNENIQYSSLGSRDAYSVNCPRCGNYHITRTAMVNLSNTHLNDRQIANISGWISENQIFEVTTANIDWIVKLPTPSFHEKANKILLALEKRSEFSGQYVPQDVAWQSFGWCINTNELDEILSYLLSTAQLDRQIATPLLDPMTGKQRPTSYKITPNGWAQLEKLKMAGSNSAQCFVAIWFDDQMQLVYDQAIAAGILDAGYKPHRVDQREYNDKIDDEIIAQIRRSRFIVADFTGHRGGVYYEAGFAKGLGLEVIWTCRKDELKNLHFDIRQYNCIDWEPAKLDDFRIRLKNRIERVFGQGTYQV